MTTNPIPERSFIINDSTQLVITRKIAEGGMGAVYEARQIGVEGFEKTVAIKTMSDNLTHARKQYAELFIAEAKLVADLVHENIVQIYQLGRSSSGYYIVMEYVHGLSLAQFIDHHRTLNLPLAVELAVHIISRIARGLAYAHQRQDAAGVPLEIVHRDVCPNNILITTEGLPKLADFGVAKVTKRLVLGDGSFVGKLLYMAPEQALKQHVDFRADMYSLGAVLFELLTFETIRPAEINFRAADAREWVAQPIPWHFLPQGLSGDLAAILNKMLAFTPGDRYQDTDHLARDLEYFIYKDGYGPTIQTMEEYLRRHFHYLYAIDPERLAPGLNTQITLVKSFLS
ncbi:MAG: serine/threonine protein kinase [Verrucomicrobia bacterium]|nr:serine/threonine protein kinase [Verrucomicrobiota bacterium]MBU4429760.1 serine/threonine protein kinase [Verrucomicrobiota bacterium]MCG2680380.1 serine/threonine protein kinase [Kiritimatiellia bacterium]